MNVELIPIKVKRQQPSFNIHVTILDSIKKNGHKLKNGDIVIISSKFVSMSENRIVDLANVKVKKEGKELAESLSMDPFLAQLVVDEADAVFSGVQGFALAIKNGVIAPNAGIDKSNIFHGHAILYPEKPYISAENIRKKVLEKTGKKVGIVLSDSRLMPTRIGTTGVALAVAGFNHVKDERGRKDLFGNVLKVTQRALADDLCSAAQLLMGEADEGIPIVIARNSGIKITEKAIDPKSTAVPFSECIYMTGLSNQNLIEGMRRIKSRP